MLETNNFTIVTDTTCDLPKSYIEKHNLPIMNLSYNINGVEYNGNDVPFQSAKEFYDAVREGAMPKTSQVNPEDSEKFLENILQTEDNVLCISFSSGLSGTCQSAKIAAEELNAKYPNKKILVVDSLCASLGEGLLVHYALKMRNEGKTFEETYNWLEENKLHLCHNFTVDDLNHLYRGGRVSKVAALVGTVLNIKPVLHVSDEGKLVPVSKVRGRKQSLVALVDMMEERAKGFDNKVCFISHGDCIEDANIVRDLVKERFGIEEFVINDVGPVIGSHSGPGTVALFFLGNKR